MLTPNFHRTATCILLTALVLFTGATANAQNGGGDNPGGGNPPGPPIFVAPDIAGLPPIELPPGVGAPPHTTNVPTPTPLPPILNDTGDPFPPAFFQAEATATNAMTGFGTGHPAAAPAATDSAGATDFSLNVLAQQGGDFYSYTVPETAGAVQVTYVMRTAAHSQLLAAYESSAIGSILNSAATDFNGGLVDAQYDNDVLTSLYVTWETAGHSHPFQYTPATGAAGSASALDFTSIETLVNDHLDGPAKDSILGALHTAQAEYNTLAVPEPSTAILIGMAIMLVAARVAPTFGRSCAAIR
jgi:hypothetical protein